MGGAPLTIEIIEHPEAPQFFRARNALREAGELPRWVPGQALHGTRFGQEVWARIVEELTEVLADRLLPELASRSLLAGGRYQDESEVALALLTSAGVALRLRHETGSVRHDLLLEAMAAISNGRFRPDAPAQHRNSFDSEGSFLRGNRVYRFQLADEEGTRYDFDAVLGAANRCLRDEGVEERFVLMERRIEIGFATIIFAIPSALHSFAVARYGHLEVLVSEDPPPRTPFGFAIAMPGTRDRPPSAPRREPPRPAWAGPDLWLREHIFSINPEGVVSTSRTPSLSTSWGHVSVRSEPTHETSYDAVQARASELLAKMECLRLGPWGSGEEVGETATRIEPFDASYLDEGYLLSCSTPIGAELLVSYAIYGRLSDGTILCITPSPRSGTKLRHEDFSLFLDFARAVRLPRPEAPPPTGGVWTLLDHCWVPLPAGFRPPSEMTVELETFIEVTVREDSTATLDEEPSHHEVEMFQNMLEHNTNDRLERRPPEPLRCAWGTGRLYTHVLRHEVLGWNPTGYYDIIILAEVLDGRGLHASFVLSKQMSRWHCTAEAVDHFEDIVRNLAESSAFRRRSGESPVP